MTPEEQARVHVHAKIGSYLRSWQDLVWNDDQDGWYSVPWQSAAVLIHPIGLDDGSTWVSFVSFLLYEPEISAALYRYIATNQPWVGGLDVRKDDEGGTAIRYQLLLLADYLDEAEFRQYLLIFANHANNLDDKLQTLFGGELALG